MKFKDFKEKVNALEIDDDTEVIHSHDFGYEKVHDVTVTEVYDTFSDTPDEKIKVVALI